MDNNHDEDDYRISVNDNNSLTKFYEHRTTESRPDCQQTAHNHKKKIL